MISGVRQKITRENSSEVFSKPQRYALFFLLINSILFLLSLVFIGYPAKASNAPVDSEKSRFENEWAQDLKNKITTDLIKYCSDGCSLLGIEVDGRELFDTSSANLGFENLAPTIRRFSVNRAHIEILVDNRIGSSNIERLQDVLNRSSRRYGVPVEIELTRITLPDSAQMARAEADSKKLAFDAVKATYEKVISDFCPEECRLNSVEINSVRVPVDEAHNQPSRRVFVISESKWALLVRGSTVNMTIDERMSDERRLRIEDMMRDSMEAFGVPSLNVKRAFFPRTARQLEIDQEELRTDPWGLEKLGSALRIFREFANTKEIIRERDRESVSRESEKNKEALSENKTEARESINKSKELTQSQQTQLEKENTQQTSQSDDLAKFWTQEKLMLVAAIAAILLIIAAWGLRFILTGKQVQHLISEGRGVFGEATSDGIEDTMVDPAISDSAQRIHLADQQRSKTIPIGQPLVVRSSPPANVGLSDEIAQRLNLQSLRDELTQAFITQPKLAREVFTRILREDGVEFSAKCVSVLGEMIVFDLASDDDLKKEVALLAEYIHVSTPFVSENEQLSVLRNLKLKMTAGKMRLLTQRMQDSFDFLGTQSARQIYNLISDESARSQAVVLTQLNPEKRRAVYELFGGTLKNELLRELCVKEALPRDYLQNVAEALRRKQRHSRISEGEALGGADVIIDLMERLDLPDQASMMADLDRNNPDLSRQVRSRLVSVESLTFLSDGLLLEIFLSMEPQAMVVFLAGVREHVRDTILNKAPDEVASDWTASASSIRGIDPETFRLAEMQVLGKIRAFSSSGIINIAEINEIMFPKLSSGESETPLAERSKRVQISSLIVA